MVTGLPSVDEANLYCYNSTAELCFSLLRSHAKIIPALTLKAMAITDCDLLYDDQGIFVSL